MPQPLTDYFAQEAGDFLDRLDALLAAPEAPDAVQFFRLARGVRGSAQIAGVAGVAAVAERLEDAARSLRDGQLAWSAEVRERARATAADLRALVSAAGRWGPADDARAREAAARWEGTPAPRARGEAHAGGELFVFVRREIGGVVAELDRVLAELAAAPAGREPLRTVLRRMRPVRGVAGMEALAPVLELLEGIEDAAHEVLARTTPVEARELELLGAGRDALRAAGEALERGASVGEGPELERFRELRDRAEGEVRDEDVVAISELFYDDAGPHVVSSPLAPVAEEREGTAVDEVERFLRIEATGFLDRAEGLIASLTQRPGRRFGRVAHDLRELALGVRDLAVTYGMAAIAGAAEEAEKRLAGAASAEEARAALGRLRAALPGAVAEAVVEVEPELAEPAASDLPPPPVASGASSAATASTESGDGGVVPVEALLYEPGEALREALAMRPRIVSLSGAGAGTPLHEALDELFALVERGLEGRAA